MRYLSILAAAFWSHTCHTMNFVIVRVVVWELQYFAGNAVGDLLPNRFHYLIVWIWVLRFATWAKTRVLQWKRGLKIEFITTYHLINLLNALLLSPVTMLINCSSQRCVHIDFKNLPDSFLYSNLVLCMHFLCKRIDFFMLKYFPRDRQPWRIFNRFSQ